MLKLKDILAFMSYFDSDMSNNSNTVVYFIWKTVIYIYVCRQCRTIYVVKFEHTIFINMYFYDWKVSRIDGASVTIILCLHVLIARRILLILNMLIIFSEYRC